MKITFFKTTFLLVLLLTGMSNIGAAQNTSENRITVFTIGDSTMANKKAEVAPETGWCEVFSAFVDQTVEIKNRAVNGRSTKSFIELGILSIL